MINFKKHNLFKENPSINLTTRVYLNDQALKNFHSQQKNYFKIIFLNIKILLIVIRQKGNQNKLLLF